jgi:hypothetical protein
MGGMPYGAPQQQHQQQYGMPPNPYGQQGYGGRGGYPQAGAGYGAPPAQGKKTQPNAKNPKTAKLTRRKAGPTPTPPTPTRPREVNSTRPSTRAVAIRGTRPRAVV